MRGRPGEDDGLHRPIVTEPLDHLREERVAVAVVERDLGRGTDDDDHTRRVEAELDQHSRVRCEPGEVVLLLQARIAANLGSCRSEPIEPFLRDRVGSDDPGGGARTERVLGSRVLVVVGVRRSHPERARAEG